MWSVLGIGEHKALWGAGGSRAIFNGGWLNSNKWQNLYQMSYISVMGEEQKILSFFLPSYLMTHSRKRTKTDVAVAFLHSIWICRAPMDACLPHIQTQMLCYSSLLLMGRNKRVIVVYEATHWWTEREDRLIPGVRVCVCVCESGDAALPSPKAAGWTLPALFPETPFTPKDLITSFSHSVGQTIRKRWECCGKSDHLSL